MTSTVTNPAPAPLATVVITTDSGRVTVPCEPINEWLAITPAFGMDTEGKTWLDGTFVITHIPTGLNAGEGSGCINCCRASGEKLAEMDADWSALTAENGAAWTAALSDQDRETLSLYRAIEWGCDAELCDVPVLGGAK